MDIILVTDKKGEARIDSRTLATALGNQHKNVMSLIQDYRNEFEALGQLPFETELGQRPQGGGNPARFALLNENQCYFLLTLVRNSEVVVALKLQLVKAFAEARSLISHPTVPVLPEDPVLAQLDLLKKVRISQLQLEQRTEAIEQRLDHTPISFYADKEGLIHKLCKQFGYVHPKRFRGAYHAFYEAFGTADAPLAKYSSLPACRFQEAVEWLQLQIRTFSAQRTPLDE